MTFTMIRTFCVFNALVFLAGAVAFILGFGQYAVGASIAFCLLNAAGAVLFDKLVARKPREFAKPAEEAKPALTPGQMLANQRWQRRA